MSDALREMLYPLGFLASIAFTSRGLIQWLSSEAKRKSYVSRNFWKLSLAGNLMLALHALIQVQYHVCLVQACNIVISWRNLNLMKPVEKQRSIETVLKLFVVAVAVVTSLFFFTGEQSWFRIPLWNFLDNPQPQVLFSWHLVGFLGVALFSSRFWVQWWCAEKQQKSYLGRPFWWVSLIGALLSVIYFSKIKDPVNLVGPLVGMVPYIRNLFLIQKSTKETTA